PGDYVFELKSANSDGKFSSTVSTLDISISPPWWQTWWFRLSALLAIAGIVTILVRRRIAVIRNKAELKHRMAETEMMALRAQMNPHFIFNCINSIDGLIQSNDKYHATVYLNKFAKLIRNILDSSKQNMIPLSKDIDTLNLYIELEQLRNENKFTAEIKADDQLLQHDYKVPPLIIQPFVENAILHGLRNRTDNDGKLTVSIARQNGHLQYIVEDNGVGRFAESNSLKKEKQSYGMQITSDRVKLFNNESNPSVEVTDLVENGRPKGTRVTVYLKIK
ncbi:MAG: histidine kinase, partial [Chitinophagaceae bacterium]|nr:histidine kinase [Chitinophagaceae bacterium]